LLYEFIRGAYKAIVKKQFFNQLLSNTFYPIKYINRE